jgi:hypothetical protein
MRARLPDEHSDRETYQDTAQQPGALRVKKDENPSQTLPALERQGYAQCKAERSQDEHRSRSPHAQKLLLSRQGARDGDDSASEHCPSKRLREPSGGRMAPSRSPCSRRSGPWPFIV